MMDAFSYLSVLLSIILGLAITQILQGFRGLMLARSRLRAYWPCVLWAILLLVIDVQSWWAMFGLREHRDWTFLAFSVVIAQTVVQYLLAALVLPDFDGNAPVDLREYYYANHRWFFSLIVLLMVVSISKGLVVIGAWPAPLDLGFQLLFLVSSMIGALTRYEGYHKFLAPFATLSIFAYIALLFTRLV